MNMQERTDNFIKRAKNIHGTLYDYGSVDYKNLETKVSIICLKHGEFEQTPRTHTIQKHGCPDCGKEYAKKLKRHTRLTTEQFIINANTVHNNQYDYSKAVYVRNTNKITITCPDHGTFDQTPTNHISLKQGCPECGNTKKAGKGGYTEGYFKINPEEKEKSAIFYVIHMKCETDDFIKIGITTRTIKQRYARTHAGDKYINKQVLLTRSMTLYEAFNTEQQILKKLKRYQYFPNYIFDGKTECFKNKPEVIVMIMEHI